jgi:hypothetical protein
MRAMVIHRSRSPNPFRVTMHRPKGRPSQQRLRLPAGSLSVQNDQRYWMVLPPVCLMNHTVVNVAGVVGT